MPVEECAHNVKARPALAAWTARGLEGQIDIGAGPMPAVAGISINLLDTTTHSWDIARHDRAGREHS